MIAKDTTPSPSPMPSHRRVLAGTVVARSGDKTVKVEVVRTSKHALYGKQAAHTKRYLVHDPENKAEVGQAVEIQESRPLSRHKRWTIVKKHEA